MKIAQNASANTIEEFLDRLSCGRTTPEGRRLLEVIKTVGWSSYQTAAKNKELVLVHYRVVLGNPRAAGHLCLGVIV